MRRLRRFLPLLAAFATITVYWWDALTSPVTLQAAAVDDDVLNYFRPLNLFHFAYAEAFGTLPDWFDRAGLGYPSAAVGQHGIDYFPRLLGMLVAPTAGAAADLLAYSHALVAVAGAWALARLYGISPWSSTLAATLYGLAHLPVRWAPFYHAPAYFAWLPPALLGLELIWRRRPWVGVPLLGISLGMAGLGGHLQNTHLLVQLLALVTLYRVATDERPWRGRIAPLAQSAAGAVLGLAASAVVWLPFLTLRGDATRRESPIDAIVGMGSETSRSFYDPAGATSTQVGDSVSGDLYLGLGAPALIVLGFVLALRRRDLAVLPLVVLTAALIAYKTPLLDLLVAVVPGWEVVSNVARLSFAVVLPMALLAGFGLDWAAARTTPRRSALLGCSILVASAVVWTVEMDGAGLASPVPLVLALAGGAAIVLAVWRLPAERGRVAVGVLVPLLFVATTFAGTLQERKLGWEPVADVAQPRFENWLRLVGGFDSRDGRWMSHCQTIDAPGYLYRPITFLEAPGRWLDTYDSFVSRPYYLYWSSLTGSKRYEQPLGGQWYMGLPESPNANPALVNAAGIDRVLGHVQCTFDQRSLDRLGWRIIGSGNDGFVVYANDDAFPMAYISGRWRDGLTDPEQAVRAVAGGPATFGRHTDFVEGDVAGIEPAGRSRPAALARDGAERLVVDFGAPLRSGSLVIVLDAYDDGWQAYAGSRELPLRRANGVFRAVAVPAGVQSIEMRYEPWWRPALQVLSWLALLSMAAALTFGLLRGRRRARR